MALSDDFVNAGMQLRFYISIFQFVRLHVKKK